MNNIVPPSLLFDFQIPIPACEMPSTSKSGRLLKLSDSSRLFLPSSLNAGPVFGAIAAGWNTKGFGLQVTVSGKPDAPTGRRDDLKRSDCLLVWLDTRPSGSVHRATEYCHHFACLPHEEDSDSPLIVVQPIAQQRLQRIESDPKKILTRLHTTKDGYQFEVWFPADQLYGFREIAELRRLGFHCVIQDSHLGNQSLGLSGDFPASFDPSLWLNLELVS